LDMLLARDDITVDFLNKKDTYGKTALHYACRHFRLEQLEKLLNKGASLKVPDNEGNTPLHLAAGALHTDPAYPKLIRYLLDRGADDTQENRVWKTPVQIAIGTGEQNNVLPFVSFLVAQRSQSKLELAFKITQTASLSMPHIFFELGKMLFFAPQLAIKAYSKIPRKSKHYSNAQYEIGAAYFYLGTGTQDPQEKLNLFQLAFRHAYASKDVVMASKILQHLAEGDKVEFNAYNVDPEQVQEALNCRWLS